MKHYRIDAALSDLSISMEKDVINLKIMRAVLKSYPNAEIFKRVNGYDTTKIFDESILQNPNLVVKFDKTLELYIDLPLKLGRGYPHPTSVRIHGTRRHFYVFLDSIEMESGKSSVFWANPEHTLRQMKISEDNMIKFYKEVILYLSYNKGIELDLSGLPQYIREKLVWL